MLHLFMIQTICWVHARLCKLQKGCTPLDAASDTVYQLLAHGLWFSLGTPVSSTNKTGCHDIAEILLKVALNTNNQINQIRLYVCYFVWVRSGQEEYSEIMYISIFKTLMLLFELPYCVVLSTYLIFILMFLYMIQIHLSDSKILILLTLYRTE
jgi:hypothetical protein